MDPDSLIAGLRRELVRNPKNKAAIEAEIQRVDKRPRPVKALGETTTVFDRSRAYLAGLYRERERSGEEHRKAVEAEIERVESKLRTKGTKAERAERPANQAVNKPVAERAVSAPAES